MSIIIEVKLYTTLNINSEREKKIHCKWCSFQTNKKLKTLHKICEKKNVFLNNFEKKNFIKFIAWLTKKSSVSINSLESNQIKLIILLKFELLDRISRMNSLWYISIYFHIHFMYKLSSKRLKITLLITTRWLPTSNTIIC